ncbi:hypothetical protein EJ06DRAFT_486572 [Trichodelitschia bisporula]|uniref:Meiotically up-regulated gene 190 protein n=1 Tax=Trichodelitschia bisporula TaxID=703511 RepID=A0A6G1IBH1_9PEZI|nr:hypothetical protein EJ06DRAFT_486572 [Trichodelitschia bisporula]
MSGLEDAERQPGRRYGGPYTPHNPVPTVQHYREEKEARGHTGKSDREAEEYKTENQNVREDDEREQGGKDTDHSTTDGERPPDTPDSPTDNDTSETSQPKDTKAHRKAMKKSRNDPAERQVTDPVTHLPVTIHDFTKRDLETVPRDDTEKIDSGDNEDDSGDADLGVLFPPPEYEALTGDVARLQRFVLGLASAIVVAVAGIMAAMPAYGHIRWILGALLTAGLLVGLQQYATKKTKDICSRYIWAAEREEGKKRAHSEIPESTAWLNQILGGVWPLVNPDLFVSLADTLEDVMQASLPRMVKMVSVEDIGQGSEPVRILGVRWLPRGQAAKAVSEDGKVKDEGKNDRRVSGEGEQMQKSDTNDKSDDDEQQDQNLTEGMEAEEGDFVNVEIAFAYRAKPTVRGAKSRSKNAHLYLAFYLPFKLPVWVEIHGLIGIVRMRLQLTPDPPFFSLCTLSFLGQPHVSVSCTPLTKHGLNIMDVPLISNFVQSAVDAAAAQYVAPKSLTLDLKEMLVGEDFKKDTTARGVLVVRVRSAKGFKEGDAGIPLIQDGSADVYVTVGWAKFGKPVWSSRVITSMEPVWDETAFVLVTPDELNIHERVRLQLWDSDRGTADDDLGRVEVDLKEIMTDPKTNGHMCNRTDKLRAFKGGMPGELEWSVGYFSKTRVLDSQLEQQDVIPGVNTLDELKAQVNASSERKLREATRNETSETDQQKAQDLKERCDEISIATPPPSEYPSGILSVVVHNITGLEIESLSKSSDNDVEHDDGDDLPSAFVDVVLNHAAIFRTRTKPKNSKPFFNAGCERFVRDWQSAEVHLGVWDSRPHEDDALVGTVFLPLAEIFKDRSQIAGTWPLSGGIGFGRLRISLVWRSVQLQLPQPMRGWDVGTLELQPRIRGRVEGVDGCTLKLRTDLGKGKYSGAEGGEGWKRDKPLRLGVNKRFRKPLVCEFKKHGVRDKVVAFAVLWLHDVPDGKDHTAVVPVWTGDLKRATANVDDKYGTKVGEIEVQLRMWPGLSGWHSKLAAKEMDVGRVMEVVECAGEADGDSREDEAESSSSSSDSDSSDDDGSKDLEKDGKRGPVDSLKDYKRHRKTLHRQHRGAMQWKGPRTAQWVQHKATAGAHRVADIFHHHEGTPGMETEV